ncbi:MAG: alanine dehydrogenase [Anaerolineales bacterium]|nr:MAG: alanine dehydrogenase [Anaerolineales bacterium]
MAAAITFGLARMREEYGERRDFLPSLVADLEKRGALVHLEFGYGTGLGLTEEDYLKHAPGARFVSNQEVFKQQNVLVLRCPSNENLRMMEPGACLISMLHYPTRPQRVEILRNLEIEAVSLDSLKDDSGRRLIENLRSVAWNGLEAGFQVLHRSYPSPGLGSPKRTAIHATVLGVGEVGIHAVQAASRYGNPKLWQTLASRGTPGVQVTAVDYDLTGQEDVMREILVRTDVLVDATQRRDTSKVVISNQWVGWLPEHAVIVDLSVDPYICEHEPFQVKAIEGIPQGNLDQYVFKPDDPAYGQIPDCVSNQNRRYVVSCYSWPGIHPKQCMKLYGAQIRPVLRSITDRGGIQNVNPHGRYFERAIGRAMLSQWISELPGQGSIKPEQEDKG